MNRNYIIPNEWSIIEKGFDPDNVEASESIFSLGNGAMGQRANFEESYSGKTFQGSYIAGVYYPDKTRVGWWKNGYPEYFAKVLNAPNWIGIDITVNGQTLDLSACKEVKNFYRELNMKEGWLQRSFIAVLQNGVEIQVKSTRFLSLTHDELGVINYEITPINNDATIIFLPYIDAGIKNQDSNWDDKFWEITNVKTCDQQAFIESHTLKTYFYVCTFMQSLFFIDGKSVAIQPESQKNDKKAVLSYSQYIQLGQTFTIQKYGGYATSLNHDKENLITAAKNVLNTGVSLGYETLLYKQKEAWAEIWSMSDITIAGDVKAQQGIRFNIFQLNQTYLGKDARLNIGPKGFTGEKYGGSTYWDTEAYCIPFYMATKNQQVARNLLTYRYNQLQKAIENAKKLGFSNGAALYPMVTMNGEESHNEWEITFEEIHRNGTIAYAIFNYTRYTGDQSYIPEKGLEVLIGIARFWHQRTTFSQNKNKYVILGVTGPNEYENNINNNWYTNYIAKWCIDYTISQIEYCKTNNESDFVRIMNKTKLSSAEIAKWKEVAGNMFFPYDDTRQIFLQQEGFLDKELIPASQLEKSQRPINQHWSWDRILRSVYIKQADVLQGFYFFEDHFSIEELQKHFDFYEPFTVHESSLSPCIHAIQAARLGRMEQAYQFYLRTSRLDLDDYNHEVHEGCHITSMAGSWMSIVEGFGGMRVMDGKLNFNPQIPENWDSYSFKINFRNQLIKVSVSHSKVEYKVENGNPLEIISNGKRCLVSPEKISTV